MDILKSFSDIAPYLKNPLVLCGFVLLLFFAVLKGILKSGIIPPLKAGPGSKVVNRILLYGLVIALLVIIFGFALAFYQERNRYEEKRAAKYSVVVELEKNRKQHLSDQKQLQETELEKIILKRDIQDLTEAIDAISAEIAKPNLQSDKIYSEFKKIQFYPREAANIAEKMFIRNEAEAKAASIKAGIWALRYGILLRVYDPKEAIKAYRKAIELDPDNFDGWLRLGDLLYSEYNYADAETAFKKVLEIRGPNTNDEINAVVANNLGSIYIMRNDLENASKNLEKALGHYKALGYQENKAAVLHNLGKVYAEQRDYDRALSNLKEAKAINSLLKDEEALAGNLRVMGEIYGEKNDLVLAKLQFEEALKLDREVGDRIGEADDLSNLGTICRRQCNPSKALELHLKALNIYEADNDKFGIGCANKNMATAYRDRGKIDKAQQHYRIAIQIFKENGMVKKLKETYEWLAKLDDPLDRECPETNDFNLKNK